MRGHSDRAGAGVSAGLLVTRLALAAVFIPSGFDKLTGLSGTEGFFASVGIPLPGLFAVLVAVAEFFGGIGLLVGVLARFSGAVLAVDMLVAILAVKFPQGGWQASRLEFMLIAAGLTIVLAGVGRWSLPKLLDRPDLDLETPLWRKMTGRGPRRRP